MPTTSTIAVVTGGGGGIGRALVRRLAMRGVRVATCDLREAALEETHAVVKAEAGDGAEVLTVVADVTDEVALIRLSDEVRNRFQSDRVDLLINNAGVGGGGSFVLSAREEWERTFDVCWKGVYLGTRVFLPSLMRSPNARLVNVSSVNGFWASLGPETAHTAYSAAKFAVKGFTEALIGDLRLHAPNVAVSLVMPGHVGTGIVRNTVATFAGHLGEAERDALRLRQEAFEAKGLTPDEAAAIILDGVERGRWRILVGADAVALDTGVRADPEGAYDAAFYQTLPSVERR